MRLIRSEERISVRIRDAGRGGTPRWPLEPAQAVAKRKIPFQARLLSSISMLAGIFVAIAAVIFSTYFDQLVVLRRDLGHFITDNDSMHSAASQVMAVSLNGLSLTVVSFTIVFLFHSVGGGLYCGTVLFRYV